ncbi:PfkB family carbohydrate kinase [Thiorhodococcus fuscus]|uniref:pyridoxal kinase n=1 Tax=Thiorhodococcus fuscus TaxID=527200 RepID=A0ABW4Y7N4_9GAMM
MTPTRPVPVDVISIQSQVVYGRVGNNAAIPALEACGLLAAAVPTTLLSNTPHYPSVHGGAVPEAWLAGWLDDLEARGIPDRARVVQIGFLGDPAQARILASWWSRIHERHPHLRLHLDPVIGDYDHGVYVADGMAEALTTRLVPAAHGLVPNRFELEQLTGTRLRGLDDCREAARALLHGAAQWIVVTSVQGDPEGAVVQTLLETRDGTSTLFEHPRVPCAVKGVGDYFAARLTGHLLLGCEVSQAVDRACRETTERLDLTRHLGWEELAIHAPGRSAKP